MCEIKQVAQELEREKPDTHEESSAEIERKDGWI